MRKVTLAITGASGMPFATQLLQELLSNDCIVHLVVSAAGVLTFNQEMDFSLPSAPHKIHEVLTHELKLVNADKLMVYGVKDWFAPIASGSSVDDVMIVCPCSMATLAKIANGIGDDLICRAADVVLKERKNLIIVPRETPLSSIHLDNMLKLSNIGVSVIPPVPAFYTKPQTIDDVVKFVVSRILDQAQISNNLSKRW
ncbi:MAG: UbiX family flavin prenyltransferase [Neisseriaceae bacterium]|jgi:4-hydroxy-3-polyprenylbenzoate decarboxylase|nr:MAG: UbiX family flavin prenyltransferase [Neisseriaceae bacterium]